MTAYNDDKTLNRVSEEKGYNDRLNTNMAKGGHGGRIEDKQTDAIKRETDRGEYSG
jgi:hypothetical protein